MNTSMRIFLLCLLISSYQVALAAADSTAGRVVFEQCKACHSLQPGQNRIGPSLAGIIGRKVGTVPGYDYSPAMRKSNVTWTKKNLAKFIAAPRNFMPGTKMPFAGIADARERVDLIAYLQQAGFSTAGGAVTVTTHSIVRDPGDLPSPIGTRGPQTVKLDLKAEEIEGRLADGVGYDYWTFNGKVPGPLLRVRVGDTVQLTLSNDADSSVTHSVDLHAVTGPGGGAAKLQVPPGESKSVTFKALKPGLFVYHCATPMIAHHISNGMYGMILVEPAGGLPPVDKEFYIMQGEIYTKAAYGAAGMQTFSVDKLLNERPEYYVFNGAVGALTKEHPLRAEVGDKVRIFFGVGGPNATSSFHVIGEIFDHVYEWGGLTSPPLEGIQTVLVPPGGAAIADLTLDIPGKYIIVDHALSRLERGLAAYLIATGKDNPEIFHAGK